MHRKHQQIQTFTKKHQNAAIPVLFNTQHSALTFTKNTNRHQHLTPTVINTTNNNIHHKTSTDTSIYSQILKKTPTFSITKKTLDNIKNTTFKHQQKQACAIKRECF